jgi:CelD/BcsL family acetyltransferase involved in cellulose biosynthesis
LAFRRDPAIAVPKIAYNENFKRLSPGNLLVARFFEHCCAESGLKWADFQADAAWHQPWGPIRKDHHWFYRPVQPLLGLVPMALLRLPSGRFG